MLNYKGSIFTTSIADSAFTYNDTITQDDGFRIAVGFDTRWLSKNISDYLELSVRFYNGDYTGDKIDEKNTTFDLHTCTDEEID